MPPEEECYGKASDHQETRTLTDRDRDVLLALLDEDATQNEALGRAFEAHSVFVDQKEFHLPLEQ